MLEVKIKTKGFIPFYATKGSVAADLQYFGVDTVIIKPGHSALIPTGIQVALPEGYELQVRPRSGIAIKHGVTVLNTPGTIDSDYRGEVGVILINHGILDFRVNPGDRIAQAVVSKVEIVEFVRVDDLDTTERGDGGFGHTGI